MENNNEKKLKLLENVLGKGFGKIPQIQFYCPKCNHHKKKLSINIEEEIFQCWVCKYSDVVLNLLKKYSSVEIQNKWKELSNNKYSNINLDNDSFRHLILSKLFKINEEEIEEKIQLEKEFKKITKNSEANINKKAIEFLNNRDISYNTILKYNFHYCDQGRLSNRVILPSYGENGYLNYWVARCIFDNYLKYKNASNHKDKIIFNDLFISWEHEINLVEGPFDAIKNDINAIPILGSSLSEKSELFKKIVKNKAKINLIFDSDAAGKNALLKSGKLLLSWGIETYYTDINPFKDPGEMNNKQINEAIKNKKLLTDTIIMTKVLE